MMKLLLFCLCIITATQAQVVPTTPTKFGKRNLGASTTSSTSSVTSSGGSASTGVAVPKTETTVRTITYITLSGSRQWKSDDGRPLIAKLIAFEDMVVETLKSDPASTTTMPKQAGKPTVIKDGKVRLLAANTPHEVALDRLSLADREFIGTVQRAVNATPLPTK